MNILIVHTPRSKSTMVHDILAKKFDLEGLYEPLTFSRIAKQDSSEYDNIIRMINTKNNVCVKINGNDFIDLKNKKILDDYKKIHYDHFDKIVFITRENYFDAISCYAYMIQKERASWHKKKGVPVKKRMYEITSAKIYYLLRGYFVYNVLTDYIASKTDNILRYEYEDVDDRIGKDFGLREEDFDIDIEPMGIDYPSLATNYKEARLEADSVYKEFKTLTIPQYSDPASSFWRK